MGNCITRQQHPDSPPLDGIKRRGRGRSGEGRKIPCHVSLSDEATQSTGVNTCQSPMEDGIEHHPKAIVHQQIPVLKWKASRIIKGFSTTVELNMAENTWMPSSRMVNDIQDVERAQGMYGRLRSICNKLTPENFDQLMKQAKELPMTTAAQLEGVSKLLFERAIYETKFVSLYAKMCHHLKDLTFLTSVNPKLCSNFLSFLLYHCRMECNKVKSDGVALETEWQDQRAKMEGGSQYLKELEAKVMAHRRRSVGCMRFLAELYKLEMVRDACILGYLTVFLDTLTEEALECMCCLLAATGSILDTEKNKPQLDRHFSKIGSVLKRRKMTPRVQFKLLDLIDLRLNNWLPRREEEGPKRIEDIHEEFELESQLEIEEELPEQLLCESTTVDSEEWRWTMPIRKNPQAASAKAQEELQAQEPAKI